MGRKIPILSIKNRKAPVVTGAPVVSFSVPTPALSGSGYLSIISDSTQGRTTPTRNNLDIGLK
jgi:hypothetical protein